MSIMLTRSMKKNLKEVLQDSAQGGPLKSQEGMQPLKMELEHMVTFHNGKLEKLVAIIKNPT